MEEVIGQTLLSQLEVAQMMTSDRRRVIGVNPTAKRTRSCALSALRLSVLGCFAWSRVSSADLHVVENTFG
jgi:hypothetical protein